MPRHLIRQFTARLQPAVDRVTSNPTVRRFAPAIADPDLWHLNRRSTARAVAIGLFCGLIPGRCRRWRRSACSLDGARISRWP
jgi:hypothetical protein